LTELLVADNRSSIKAPSTQTSHPPPNHSVKMPSRTLIAASVLVAVANAQASTSSAASVAASTTVSQSMPPSATAGFNPALVNSTIAYSWCQGQRNSCPQICGGAAGVNTCDQNTFTYSCVCGDGTVPDCTAYTQTLPFFICQDTFSQCIEAHPNDAAGQQACTQAEVCGTKNATAALVSASESRAGATMTTSMSSAASSSGSAATSGSGGSGGSSASASATAASSSSPAVNQQVATGAFAAILMAAFKLLI
jgi:hypothetical protein